MKNIVKSGLLLFIIIIVGCNKEPAIDASAEFSLNKTNLEVRESFVLFADKIEGEWAVYLKGNDSTTTYSKDFYRAIGTPIDLDLDSISIPAYNFAGEYSFTVVASSSGNWAEDYLQDVKTVTVTVTE